MSTLDVGRPDHLWSAQVTAMVNERYGGEVEITDACAVTIASWWQGPTGHGLPFAQLASTGRVEYVELAEAIYDARKSADASGKRELDMLGTWALRKEIGRP